jgi:hypothetical protein
LHLLRTRLTEGKWNKAERGELLGRQPTGYVRQPSGDVIFDPDEQVQSVIRLIFEKSEELRTGRQVFWYLRKNGIRIPVRLAYGPNQGQLEWREPATSTPHLASSAIGRSLRVWPLPRRSAAEDSRPARHRPDSTSHGTVASASSRRIPSLYWIGGYRSQHEIRRSVALYGPLRP